jgi:Interferon-induced transmembrane protein
MSYGHPPGGHALPGPPPPAYRAWVTTAVICGVLFNIILGLPTALIGRRYSTKVTGLWARGDGPGAVSASRRALAWLIASIVLDVMGLVLSIVFFLHAPSSHR